MGNNDKEQKDCIEVEGICILKWMLTTGEKIVCHKPTPIALSKSHHLHASTFILSSPVPKAHNIPIKLSSVCVCLCVHTFKDEYLRNQWADRNQILSKESLG